MRLDRAAVLQKIDQHGGSEGLDLSGLDMVGIDLSGVDLHGARLAQADLREADLRWANLRETDLAWTVLQTADIRWADLRGANLRQADLRGANLWGANLTDANVSGTELSQADLSKIGFAGTPVSEGGANNWLVRAIGRERLRQLTTSRNLALIGFALLSLLYVCGFAYNATYFDQFGVTPTAALDLVSAQYLLRGWEILSLTLRFLISLPLIILYALIVIAILLVIPLAFIFLGDRLLGYVPGESLRRIIILALFAGYMLSFLMLFPWLVPLWEWLTAHAIPSPESFATLSALISSSSALGKLFLVLAIALLTAPLWLFYRLLCQYIQKATIPATISQRFTQSKNILATLQRSGLFARGEPLNTRERNLALSATAVLLLSLPILFTQTAVVRAQKDMCSGGELPQITLYSNELLKSGTTAIDSFGSEQACLRLLLLRGSKYFVFYPAQTRGLESRRRPVVYEVSADEAFLSYHSEIRKDCLICTDTETVALSAIPLIVVPTPTVNPTVTPTPGPDRKSVV